MHCWLVGSGSNILVLKQKWLFIPDHPHGFILKLKQEVASTDNLKVLDLMTEWRRSWDFLKISSMFLADTTHQINQSQLTNNGQKSG